MSLLVSSSRGQANEEPDPKTILQVARAEPDVIEPWHRQLVEERGGPRTVRLRIDTTVAEQLCTAQPNICWCKMAGEC